MKRTWILLAVSAMGLALFTGCASNADVMPDANSMTTTSPTATAGTPAQGSATQPSGTDGPMMSTSPDMGSGAGGGMGIGTGVGAGSEGMDVMTGAGVNSVEDARRVSAQVSEEVARLSELDSAEAVVAGSIALVGISYDAQYQGGLTDRVEEMVTERVEMIDKAITSVHVTDEEEAVMKISGLYERLKGDDITFEELQTQVLTIGSGIAGGSAPQVSQPKSDTGA